MINFRYHLVSLTAVFLALAAGITIGAGVVDRATVTRIESQLRNVDSRREQTNAENDRLKTDLGRWTRFSDQASDTVVEGRLTGAPIFLVATTGVDRQLVDDTRDTFTTAGASVDGVLWFTSKWALTNEDDIRRLAGVLDAAPTTRPDDLRTAGLIGVATAWGVGGSGSLVTSLLDAGFFEFDAPSSSTAPLVELPRAGSLFVVVSGDKADVPSPQLAEPLVDRLSAFALPVLAAQPMRPLVTAPAEEEEKKLPPEFVFSLRAKPEVSGRISSVDNLDDPRGQISAILGLQALRSGRTGHYGFGPDARIVPEAP